MSQWDGYAGESRGDQLNQRMGNHSRGGKMPSSGQIAEESIEGIEISDPSTEGSLTAVAPPDGNFLDHGGKNVFSVANGMRNSHTEQDISAPRFGFNSVAMRKLSERATKNRTTLARISDLFDDKFPTPSNLFAETGERDGERLLTSNEIIFRSALV